MSIIRYGAAIWGNKEYSCINAVHNRMCRYYLGVGKFTPNAAIQGDMGVRLPWQFQKLEICRQWCRFVNMPDQRLNKKVFIWCNKQNVKNWNYKVRSFLISADKTVYTEIEHELDKSSFLNDVKECTERANEQQWLEEVNRVNSKCKKGKNKLRTYNTFKSKFTSEPYVYLIMPRSHRSAYAKFRCGTAPIKLETGRYEGIPVEDRICPVCQNGVEDEQHVLLECPKYDDIRTQLLTDMSTVVNVNGFSKQEVLKCILGSNNEFVVKKSAKACDMILKLRMQTLYK